MSTRYQLFLMATIVSVGSCGTESGFENRSYRGPDGVDWNTDGMSPAPRTDDYRTEDSNPQDGISTSEQHSSEEARLEAGRDPHQADTEQPGTGPESSVPESGTKNPSAGKTPKPLPEDRTNPTPNPGHQPIPPPRPSQWVEENFRQNDRPLLDILWVIDNSGSMRPFQTSIRDNAHSFVKTLNEQSIDFQMAVTSTDVCTGTRPKDRKDELCPTRGVPHRKGLGGDLVGSSGNKVLRADDPDLIHKWGRHISVGIRGSSFEHGLTATKLAVAYDIERSSEDALLRPGSHLAVIVLSDEEDDGVGLSRPDELGVNYWERGWTRYRYDADALVKDLTTLLPKHTFSVSSVVSTARESQRHCPRSSSAVLEVGQEYMRASELSGGLSVDICTKDWGANLTALAEDLGNQLRKIRLKHRAENDSVQVWVDGEIFEHWQYQSTRSEIIFSDGQLPVYGAEIRVKYRRWAH